VGRIPCLSGYSIQIVELENLAVLRQTLKWSSLQQIWRIFLGLLCDFFPLSV